MQPTKEEQEFTADDEARIRDEARIERILARMAAERLAKAA